jgi:hypothetical protein
MLWYFQLVLFSFLNCWVDSWFCVQFCCLGSCRGWLVSEFTLQLMAVRTRVGVSDEDSVFQTTMVMIDLLLYCYIDFTNWWIYFWKVCQDVCRLVLVGEGLVEEELNDMVPEANKWSTFKRVEIIFINVDK